MKQIRYIFRSLLSSSPLNRPINYLLTGFSLNCIFSVTPITQNLGLANSLCLTECTKKTTYYCFLTSILLMYLIIAIYYQLIAGGTIPWKKVAQLCLTLCDPRKCSLPGSSVHGILQARILEWVAISFSRGSSRPTKDIYYCFFTSVPFIYLIIVIYYWLIDGGTI